MGNENIFAFDSKIEKYSVGAGLLVPSATSSSHLFFKGSFKYPENVSVKWRKSDERVIEKIVPVKGKIPDDFRTGRDEIIFNIFPDDIVKLSFVIQTDKYSWKEIDSDGKLVDYGNKK